MAFEQKPAVRAVAVVALALLIFALRLPLVMRAHDKLYLSVDELELTQTAADRFLGVPHTQDHWPGTTNHLLLCPLLVADYLWTSRGSGPSQRSFIDYLSKFYRSPWRFFLIARLAISAISSFGLAILLPNIARRSGTLIWSWIALLLIATVPSLMIDSAAAFAIGIALGLTCVAIAVALTSPETKFEPWVTLAAGVLFGFALAGRNTAAPAMLFIAALLGRRSKRPVRTMAAFLIIAGVTFLFACPQIWVEPIRWTKANLGNYVKRGVQIGLAEAALQLRQIVPIWLAATFLAALVRLIVTRDWYVVVGSSSAFLAIIFLTAGAPIVFPRYFYAMIIVAGVVSCLGLIPWLNGVIDGRGTQAKAWSVLILTVLAVLAIANNISQTYKALDFAFQSRVETQFADGKEVESLRETVRSYGRRRVLIPMDFIPWVADLASADSLGTTARDARVALADESATAKFVTSFGLESDFGSVLADDFNEKERAFAARLRIMAAGAEHGDVNITFYTFPEKASRYGLLTIRQAVENFEKGRFDAIVVSTQSPQVLNEPIRVITPALGIATSP